MSNYKDITYEVGTKAVGISDYQLQYYPAYHAIIDCVVGGWNLPLTQAATARWTSSSS